MNAPPPDRLASETESGSEPSEPENILDRLEVRKARKPRQPREASERHVPVVDPPGADQHFRPLGHDRGRYFFFTAGGRQIRDLSSAQLGRKSELLALAPLDWWEREFADPKGNVGFSGRAVDMATNYLVRRCYSRGVFSPDQRRGRGVWRDLDTIVIHAGDRLYIDGVETDLVAAQTEAVYECQDRIAISLSDAMTGKEAAKILEWAKSLNWVSNDHARLLVGWIVVAISSGALNWRPHIFLNGPKGCGKSSILDAVLALLGGFAISATGGSSSAGLRQTLQSDALPVVFDEAEGDSKKAAENIADVLSMMRHASANLAAKVIKGGADGRATSTLVRSCFCLSAIRDPLDQAADQSRVTVLSLHPSSDESRKRNDTVTKPLADQICERAFAARFRGRVFANVPRLLESIAVFTAAAATSFTDSRMGDQIGALMGGAWVALREGVPTEAQAAVQLSAMSWADQRELLKEASDEDACLRAILEAHIKVDGADWHGEASVGELVAFVHSSLAATAYASAVRGTYIQPGEEAPVVQPAPGGISIEEADRSLAMYGIRVDRDGSNKPTGMLLISNTNGMLGRKIMAHTTWPKGWGKLLARIEGAEKPDKTIKIGGHPSRCVAVPISDT